MTPTQLLALYETDRPALLKMVRDIVRDPNSETIQIPWWRTVLDDLNAAAAFAEAVRTSERVANKWPELCFEVNGPYASRNVFRVWVEVAKIEEEPEYMCSCFHPSEPVARTLAALAVWLAVNPN